MGLSDEERISKLYWGIHRVTAIVAEIGDTREDYSLPYETPERIDRIKAITDRLWYAFLGGHRNTAFWILGGELADAVKKASGPWSTAIIGLCDEHRKDPSVYRPDRSKLPFDPFDGHLDVPGLLGESEGGAVRRAIFEMYGWTEALAYALRRYDDKLRRGFVDLDKAIADLQGECYGIFVHDEVFGRAYVLNRTLEALYGGRYGKDDDLVRKVFQKLNLHHYLSRPMGREGSLTECIGWDKWRLTHEPTPHNRILLALRIAGRRFHYDHQFKDLVAGLKDVKPKPRWERIEREFQKCKKAHETRDADGMNRYREDAEASATMAIHGYQAHEWLEKPEKPEKGKKPEKPEPDPDDE